MKVATDKLSVALRAISDPARRKMLRLLSEKRSSKRNKNLPGISSTEIEEKIGLAQPTISHHLKFLKNAGLISAHNVGTWTWYSRDETAIRKLRSALFDEI